MPEKQGLLQSGVPKKKGKKKKKKFLFEGNVVSLVQSSVTLIASPHRGYYLLLPTAHWPLSSVPRTRPTGNAGNPL